MKGKYTVAIGNNRLKYEITLVHQITILKGSSGSGKSTLVKWVEEVVKNSFKTGFHCNMRDKIDYIRDPRRFVSEIKESKGKIFFIDESSGFLFTKEFAEAVQGSDNYFVIVTRAGRGIKYLTYSVDCIYELGCEKEGRVSVNRLYSRYENVNEKIKPELVITEDSNSGYQMLSSIFNCDIISAKGKDNVFNTLEKYKDMYGSVYIIVDGSAFGNCIARLMSGLPSNTLVFTPESFEWLLLCCNHIGRFLSEPGLIHETYNYCDTVDYISWERFYTVLLSTICLVTFRCRYDKSKLPPALGTEIVKNELKALLCDIEW